MQSIREIGKDISSSWSFVDGDLQIVSDETNIGQSISNRLNTILGSLDLYYSEYGSSLRKFIGWRQSDETLQYMSIEIVNALKQDPRFQDVSVELEYTGDGAVAGNIFISYDDDSDLSLSLVLDENGVGVEV